MSRSIVGCPERHRCSPLKSSWPHSRPQNSALSPRCWGRAEKSADPDSRGRVRQFGDTATRLQGRPMSGPSVPPEILSFFHAFVALCFLRSPVTGKAGPCTDHLVTRRQGLSISLQISHLALRSVTNRNAADELVRRTSSSFSNGAASHTHDWEDLTTQVASKTGWSRCGRPRLGLLIWPKRRRHRLPPVRPTYHIRNHYQQLRSPCRRVWRSC
jgi:hypothetical protein